MVGGSKVYRGLGRFVEQAREGGEQWAALGAPLGVVLWEREASLTMHRLLLRELRARLAELYSISHRRFQ